MEHLLSAAKDNWIGCLFWLVCFFVDFHLNKLSVMWWSPPMRGASSTIFGPKSAVWQSPPTRGAILGHIWSKSMIRRSSSMRGTFWTTFGQSPMWDKVLRWGAHFLTIFGQSPRWDKVLQRRAHKSFVILGLDDYLLLMDHSSDHILPFLLGYSSPQHEHWYC